MGTPPVLGVTVRRDGHSRDHETNDHLEFIGAFVTHTLDDPTAELDVVVRHFGIANAVHRFNNFYR